MGVPSDRTITKSWMSDHSTRTSPRMRSVKLLTPSSGVRKRMVRVRPSAASATRSSGVETRGSDRRSPAARPAATAASLRSRTSSSVQ